MEIQNYYKYTKKVKKHNPGYKNHLIDVPFRMGVIGASGAGKTNFLCELIHRMKKTFEQIIVCLRSKHEPLYELLEEKCGAGIVFFENTVPSLDDYKDGAQRLIVFDDLVVCRSLQNSICDYMIRGRKFNVSVVYLSQSFYAIPKLIRQQFNYIVLKKVGSDKDIKMIIREYSLGMALDDLIRMYKDCVKDKLHFLMLDLEHDELKYRYCFQPILN